MTLTCYIIDTSSLIELSKSNPLDLYPIVWKKVEGLIYSNRLISPREVLNEISLRDDELTIWSKAHKELFIDPTPQQVNNVRDILSKYPSIINVKNRYSADPWVIALALERIEDPQQTLMIIKNFVVTEEKIRGEKVRIPYICQNFNVKAITIFEMFRIEGWVFG